MNIAVSRTGRQRPCAMRHDSLDFLPLGNVHANLQFALLPLFGPAFLARLAIRSKIADDISTDEPAFLRIAINEERLVAHFLTMASERGSAAQLLGMSPRSSLLRIRGPSAR